MAAVPDALGRIGTADLVLVLRPVRGADGAFNDAVVEGANRAWCAAAGVSDPKGRLLRAELNRPFRNDRWALLAEAVASGEEVVSRLADPAAPDVEYEVRYAPAGEFIVVRAHAMTASEIAGERLAPTLRPEVPAPPAPSELAVSGRILVVDDEEIVRAVVARTLRGLGYAVVEAPGPERVLEMAAGAGADVDLVLTDVRMPGMDGPEMVRRLLVLWPGVPIVYMSAYSPEDAFEGGMLPDGAAFLAKPFTRDALAACMASALRT